MAALAQAPLRNRVGHISRQFPLLRCAAQKDQGWRPRNAPRLVCCQLPILARLALMFRQCRRALPHRMAAVQWGCAAGMRRKLETIDAASLCHAATCHLPPATLQARSDVRRQDARIRAAVWRSVPSTHPQLLARSHATAAKRRTLPSSFPHWSMPLIAQHRMASAV